MAYTLKLMVGALTLLSWETRADGAANRLGKSALTKT
jgi:hypothetical protein